MAGVVLNDTLSRLDLPLGFTHRRYLADTTISLRLPSARAERNFVAPLLAKPGGSMGWWEGVEEPRVLIAPDPGTSGNGLGRLLLLRHPKSGNPTRYLFVNGVLQELQWFKKSFGSWFLGDYLCEDGRLYLSTPVDLVFILLPIFEEARMKKGEDPGKFRQLEEILFVDGYPEYQHLITTAENSMQVVCEVKEVGSMKFFRLDDSKVQRWLYYKVHLLTENKTWTIYFQHMIPTGFKDGFLGHVCQLKQTLPQLGKNYAVQEEKDTLVDAVSILGECLRDEPWLQYLCNHLKLDILEVTGKAQVSDAPRNDPGFVNESQEKNEDKKPAKRGRQANKPKMETESHNIKDMFTRASRKKN